MKRCPECEFIYEDDQSLCDMDGILLVFDSQKLPKPRRHLGFRWRGRIVPALAALVLSIVLVLVYNVSTRQAAKRTTYSSAGIPTSEAKTTSRPPAISTSAENTAPESKPAELPKAPEAKRAKSSATKPIDPNKKETKTTTTQRTTNTTQPQKDDSKVESIFKKTGRILKKPFKL